MADIDQPDLTTLTVELLSAFVTNNSVESGDLAGLIQSTHAALKALSSPDAVQPETTEHVPAVSVRRSLSSRDHLLSMIDGKPYKTLKRHLGTHGLTPADYRARYNLPANYPMVAPAYSEVRRAVAARLGLGGPRKAEPVAAPEAEAAPAKPPARRKEAPAPPATAAEAEPARPARAHKPTAPKPPRARKAAAPVDTVEAAEAEAPAAAPSPAPAKAPRKRLSANFGARAGKTGQG